MATLRDIVIALRVKDNTKGLDTANDKLKTAKGSASELGKELKQLVAGFGAMAAAKQAWDAVEKAVDANAKFGQGIAQIATLLPGQTSRVAELQQGIIDMAQRTGKPLADLTQGVYQVVSAFGDSPDTLKLAELAARSATAGMSSTEEALGLLSAVSKAYGTNTAEAAKRTADLAFVTVQLGKTNFPQLAAGMQRVAPVAAALGVTQEELYASFSTLIGVTGKGAEEVSTQLVQVFAGLSKRSPDAEKALRKIGYTSVQAAVQQLGYVGTVRAMIATTNGSSEAIGKLFGSVEAMGPVLALTGSQHDSFNEKLLATAKGADMADKAFTEATTGPGKLAYEMAKAQARVEAMEVALGEKMAPAVLKVREGAIEVKQAFVDAFIAQLPAIENFGRLVFDTDGKMGGMKQTAEGVAAVFRMTIGGITIVFLGLKRTVQGVLGDLMALTEMAKGNTAGAAAIRAATSADLGATDAALAEAMAEMGRSPEESRRINEARTRDRARKALGFEAEFQTQTKRTLPGGIQEKQAPDGSSYYSYGSGPYQANLPGAAGMSARAEIKQLVINIEGDKSVSQAKDIVRDGVGGGVQDAMKGAERLLPMRGPRSIGGSPLE